jgi:hypothetical protein
MQLKPDEEKPAELPTLRRSLVAASCALLSATGAVHAENTDWQIDSALLYYQEGKGRVQAVEPVVSVKRDFGDEHVLGLKLTYDALTGGSPNGAIPSASPQTFAAPSGSSLTQNQQVQTYTTASGRTVRRLDTFSLYTATPGELPLDTSFKDQRVAIDGSWSQPLTDAVKLSFGGGFSKEHDWTAMNASVGLSRDFNAHNTTLSLGLSGEHDAIKPVGGAPIAMSDYTLFQKLRQESRSSTGGQIGLTQVMTPRWLLRLNMNYDQSTGYQNDPYKIFSLVNADGTVAGYRYENRPDSRVRESAYLESRIAFRADDVLTLSYRRLKDDWQIQSDTIDLKYHWALSDDRYLEPHVRWYRQSAADFYHLFWDATKPLPQFASADPRLAAFTAPTAGFKYAMTGPDGGEWSARLDYYFQTGKNVQKGPGVLAPLDLYPGVKSIMLQFGWRFGL